MLIYLSITHFFIFTFVKFFLLKDVALYTFLSRNFFPAHVVCYIESVSADAQQLLPYSLSVGNSM